VWICRPIRQLRSLGRVFQLAPGTPRSPDHPRHDQFKALSPSFPTVDQHEMRYDEIFDSYVISFSVHILACSLDGATSPKFLILKFIIWGDTNYKQAARGRHPGVSEFTNPKTIPNGLHSPRTCVNWSPFSSSKIIEALVEFAGVFGIQSASIAFRGRTQRSCWNEGWWECYTHLFIFKKIFLKLPRINKLSHENFY